MPVDIKAAQAALANDLGVGANASPAATTPGAVPSQGSSLSQPETSPSSAVSPPSQPDSSGSSPSSETPQAPAQPDQRQGVLHRILTAIKDPGAIAEGLGAGILRAPSTLMGGVMDTEQEALQGVGLSKEHAQEVESFTGPGMMSSLTHLMLTGNWQHKGTWEDMLSARESIGKIGNNAVNQATANVASLVMGAEGLDEIKIGKWGFDALGKVGSAATRFGLTSGVVQPSASEERFSNALQALGIHTEFTDWLASNPKDQGAMEARFKNAVDASLGGAVADMVFNTGKYIWSIAKGAPEAAAKDAALTAANDTVPNIARPTEMATKAIRRAATNDNKTTADYTAEKSVDVTKDRVQAAAQDEAIEENRAEDQVRFQVKARGLPDDAYRDVGSMDKSDLSRFYEEANKYAGEAANDLDVTAEQAPELHQGIGQFKISTFQTPDDVAPFMRALLDNAPAIERPMSDEELAKVVKHASYDLGLDPNAAQAFLSDFATSAKPLPVAAGIARTMWANIVNKLSTNAAKGAINLSADELQDHLGTLATARAWGAHLIDIKAGLGRGLRAWQLPVADDYEKVFGTDEAQNVIKSTDTIPPLPRNLKELQDFYDLWKATGGDRRAMADLLQGTQTLPSSWFYLRNSLANFYTGSILAGKAIVKGWLFPGFVGTVRTVEKTSGGFMAGLNPLISSEERQQARTVAASAPYAYFQTMGDMVSSWRYALQAMKNGGQSIIGGGYSAKDAYQRLGPITDQMLSAAKQGGNWRYDLGNLINLWPRQIFSLVGGHDEFTKRLGYLGEARVQYMVDAAKKGLSGDDAAQYVHDQLVNSIDPQTGAATDQNLLNSAARSSLINSTQTGPMGEFIRTIDNWRNRVPELRYILPVFDVPANGVGEALRRVPILSYAFKETRDDLLGSNGAVAQAEAYGRWLTGGSVLGTGFGLARSGQLTGAGPTDPRARQIWLLDHRPYSIKVAGQWISYKDYEPIGGLLGMMGAVFDKSVYLAEDKGWQHHVLAGVAGIAEYMKDKSALQQLSDVLDFSGKPMELGSMWNRFAGSTESGFVPAFVKYIRNLDDPVARQKNSPFDYVLDSLPETSKQLNPMRNVLGEPLHVPNDTLLENVLPVTIASSRENDPVIQELDKMYELTGYAPGVTSQASLLHGYKDARQLTLEDGRSLYDHFMDARNEPLIEGKNVRDSLDELFKSEDYKGAAYGSASASGDAEGNASKLKMVADIFKNFNSASKSKVANDSPIANRYLAATAIKRTSPDLLGGKTLDEVASNPPLLKSLGINIEDYELQEPAQ